MNPVDATAFSSRCVHAPLRRQQWWHLNAPLTRLQHHWLATINGFHYPLITRLNLAVSTYSSFETTFPLHTIFIAHRRINSFEFSITGYPTFDEIVFRCDERSWVNSHLLWRADLSLGGFLFTYLLRILSSKPIIWFQSHYIELVDGLKMTFIVDWDDKGSSFLHRSFL